MNPKATVKAVVIALSTLATLSGCGRIDSNSQLYAPKDSYAFRSGLVGMDDAEYDCPDDPNVLPVYDRQANGTDRYKACVNRQSVYKIRLAGRASDAWGNSSDRICVFPALAVSRDRVYYKPDHRGFPLVSCVSLQRPDANSIDGQAEVTFEMTNYNALFVVEEGDRDRMQQCLLAANPALCPQEYSKGRFRQ